MTMPDRAPHQKWADQQRDASLELGYDLADATARIQWILDNLPPGESPETFIFAPQDIWQEPSAPEHVMDTRVAYLADDSVGARFKLMPDAKGEV